MGAPDLLQMLAAKGLTLRPLPDGNLEISPRGVLTDELRAMIRANKSALLAVLRGAQEGAGRKLPGEPEPNARPGSDDALARSCALLTARADAKLAKRPEIGLAVVADDELEAGCVLIAVARRGRFSCVLRVDPDRYDGVRLLELMQRHTVH